jgi:hypothetical protein
MPVYEGPESASHQGIDGSVVVFASGYLDAGSADLTSGIVGLQVGAGSNTTAGAVNLSYIAAVPGLIVEITLEDQSNEDHAFAAANIGEDYALQVDDDGVWYLDENDVTNVSMTIIGHPPDVAVGDVRARVYATFLSSATIW